MTSPGKFNSRLNKYDKLNLLVIAIILVMLMAVFFLFQRRLDKIDREMTNQMMVDRYSSVHQLLELPLK